MTQSPAQSSDDGRLRLPNGTVLDGVYQIEGEIGAGGFGITYRGRDLKLGLPVAIKEYFPAEVGNRDSTMSVHPVTQSQGVVFNWGRDGFIKEARMLAAFKHAGIVRVLRYFEANNTAYMVLEFEAGRSMGRWLADMAPRMPTQAEMDRISSGLCDALETIHGQKLVHRDIAPDNVIIRADGSPVVLDFGAARAEVAEATRARLHSVHSRSFALVKAHYSPIEQRSTDVRNRGSWSDIYSLGATLYRAVVGRAPMDSQDRVASDSDPLPPAVTAARGDYRLGFLAAIDDALRIKRQDRPQTIAQLRSRLLDVAAVAGRTNQDVGTGDTGAGQRGVSARRDDRTDDGGGGKNAGSADQPPLDTPPKSQPRLLTTPFAALANQWGGPPAAHAGQAKPPAFSRAVVIGLALLVLAGMGGLAKSRWSRPVEGGTSRSATLSQGTAPASTEAERRLTDEVNRAVAARDQAESQKKLAEEAQKRAEAERDNAELRKKLAEEQKLRAEAEGQKLAAEQDRLQREIEAARARTADKETQQLAAEAEKLRRQQDAQRREIAALREQQAEADARERREQAAALAAARRAAEQAALAREAEARRKAAASPTSSPQTAPAVTFSYRTNAYFEKADLGQDIRDFPTADACEQWCANEPRCGKYEFYVLNPKKAPEDRGPDQRPKCSRSTTRGGILTGTGGADGTRVGIRN